MLYVWVNLSDIIQNFCKLFLSHPYINSLQALINTSFVALENFFKKSIDRRGARVLHYACKDVRHVKQNERNDAMRKVEKVQVTHDELKQMTEVIKTKVRCFNPESGQDNGYTYTNDGVNGYIIQSNNIVLHRADGSLKCWFIK